MGAETLVTRGALMEQRLPLSVSMTPAELLIIYLAAGAPFGVYGFFSEADHLGKLHIARPFLKFALWPVFATQLIFLELFRRYIDDSAGRAGTGYRVAEETAKLRGVIASAIVFENNRQRRQLLEEFERFAGITAAVCEAEQNGKQSTPIILEAGGHSSPSLGAKCIFRRNRARLLEHRKRAFQGFVSELRKASTNGGPLTIEELTERARGLGAAREGNI